MKHILLLLSVVFLFSACSTKKYYEPEDTRDDLKVKESDISSSIKSFNRIGATLEDNKFLTYQGESKESLPEGFVFLNVSKDGKIIATNYKNKLLIGQEEIEVKNPVIAASLKDTKLALLYSNNTIELYDTQANKTLFKEYNALSLANDTRVTNPHFLGGLVLFPTLNGKVIIVSLKSNDSVKNIAVDPKGQFNNIIFLGVIKDSQTLITATANKIVSISPKEILAKDYEIRDILVHDKDIYVATIDGTIMKMTPNLNVVAKKKYKYSKIHALAYTDSLYALESQGYLINIDKDLVSERVYEFDFDNEEKVFTNANKIYFEDKVVELP